MKKYFSLAVACTALFFCSCTKEDVTSTAASSITAPNDVLKAKAPALKLAPNKMVGYGALIGSPNPQTGSSFQLNVADELGISCLRARTFVPSVSNAATSFLNSKYKVVLNFCSNFNNGAIPFVTDLTKYQADLNNIVAGYTTKPVVAVIENEESNLVYYNGSAQDYIKQLKVAIGVMHSYGIKVANGGITATGLNYLVYEDFIAQGKEDSAKMFQQLTHVVPQNPRTKDRGAFVDTLLQAYAAMNLDYINFHWKGNSPNTEALKAVIAYLKKVTGKQLFTNEIGQFDKDPNTLLAHMQLCTDSGFSYILWYSPDENADKRATPVHHSDQSLTPNGIAYRNYLKG